jgi:hypothetical protein
MVKFLENMGFKLLNYTPYYAQENSQVEAMNNIIIGLIKKLVGKKPKTWHETLSQILWAYRNSPREATCYSPYKQAYGHDFVLPLEINLNLVRVQSQNGLPRENYWSTMFYELNQLSE